MKLRRIHNIGEVITKEIASWNPFLLSGFRGGLIIKLDPLKHSTIRHFKAKKS